MMMILCNSIQSESIRKMNVVNVEYIHIAESSIY